MSYHFIADQHYRMPTHFGPSLGPRQGLLGRRFACIESPRVSAISATFQADKQQLTRLLPPGFTLSGEGKITFNFESLTEIEWLAGRGYKTFGVSIPATYRGKRDIITGSLLLVLWENRADPIISGREDLGFSKVYAEIPDFQYLGSNIICTASWDGFQFASLEVSNLENVAVEDLSLPESSEGTLHYKYMPKTGVHGEADSEYAVLTPASEPNCNIQQARHTNNAVFLFHRATWEQLPTLVHIVNMLEGLSIGDCLGAYAIEACGGKDLSDQRILR